MAVRNLSGLPADGTCLGQSAADLISVHGVAPTVQYAFVQSIGTLSSIGAAGFSGSGLSGFGFSSSAQLLALVAEVRDMRALLVAKGWGA